MLKKTAGIMPKKVLKTLWKETLLINSTIIFFTDFGNTLRNVKLKQKGLEVSERSLFHENENFIWWGRDSDKSREKWVLLRVVLESNRSKNFLKVSNLSWSSWFSKATSCNMEAYGFIKLCQGSKILWKT